MSEEIIELAIIFGAGVLIVGFAITASIFNKIMKYKLDIEKMRSATELQKEEIRAKNQKEIEKMFLDDRNKKDSEYNSERTAIPKASFENHGDDELQTRRHRVSE